MTTVKTIEIHEKFWEDERGWGLNPFKACEYMTDHPLDLHVVSMTPGAVRGNHYHPNVTEWMLVCGGPARFLSKPVQEETVQEIRIGGKTPVLLEIPADIQHAVRNESDGDIYLIVFSSASDPETIRCPLSFEPDASR
jgi:dTDP-4-dehydrorhamnose 3,5-epimerase-like enzyme